METLWNLLVENGPAILTSGAVSSIAILIIGGWYKLALDRRLELIRHENELTQLRTSLFFKDQSEAFKKILTAIEQVNQQWVAQLGSAVPVPDKLTAPRGKLKEVDSLYQENQLFLDSSCVAAMDLYRDCCRVAEKGPQDAPHPIEHAPRMLMALEEARYLYPRIAELFRDKIGVKKVTGEGNRIGVAEKEIGLYGAFRLVNWYPIAELGLPFPRGSPLHRAQGDKPAECVRKARVAIKELREKLKEFLDHANAKREPGASDYNDVAMVIPRYLEMLEADTPDG